VWTPIPLGIDFQSIIRPETEEERAEMAKLPYHELLGSLMFTAIVSCPDISYFSETRPPITLTQTPILLVIPKTGSRPADTPYF